MPFLRRLTGTLTHAKTINPSSVGVISCCVPAAVGKDDLPQPKVFVNHLEKSRRSTDTEPIQQKSTMSVSAAVCNCCTMMANSSLVNGGIEEHQGHGATNTKSHRNLSPHLLKAY